MTTPPPPGARPDPDSTPTPVPAPEPTGDVVSGDPPVPITVWRLPRPPAGISVSAALAHRLTVNYTARGTRVVDLTSDPHAAGARPSNRRRAAALVITAWPDRSTEQSPERRGEHQGERSTHERSTSERSTSERPLGEHPDAHERSAAQVAKHRSRGEQREQREHLDEHLARCVALLRDRGCLAVVVTTSEIPDQLGQVVQAARRSGLTYLQHIVVAHELATDRTRSGRGPRRRLLKGRHLRVHTDVLIFSKPRADHG